MVYPSLWQCLSEEESWAGFWTLTQWADLADWQAVNCYHQQAASTPVLQQPWGWRGPLANRCLGDVSVDSAVASSSAVAPCHEKVLESCSLKGHRFESLQEWQENFLLQGQLSVLLFGYPFHPWVTTVACKRSVTLRKVQVAKHVCTLCMWLCMKWHGARLYGVHRTLWNAHVAPAMPAL